jgi:hypothetical protein
MGSIPTCPTRHRPAQGHVHVACACETPQTCGREWTMDGWTDGTGPKGPEGPKGLLDRWTALQADRVPPSVPMSFQSLRSLQSLRSRSLRPSVPMSLRSLRSLRSRSIRPSVPMSLRSLRSLQSRSIRPSPPFGLATRCPSCCLAPHHVALQGCLRFARRLRWRNPRQTLRT